MTNVQYWSSKPVKINFQGGLDTKQVTWLLLDLECFLHMRALKVLELGMNDLLAALLKSLYASLENAEVVPMIKGVISSPP